MRGIIDENEEDSTYLIAWDGLSPDGTPWNNSWQKRWFATRIAKRDWESRKKDPKLRGEISANSARKSKDA